MSNDGPRQACASCRHKKRRCTETCEFAPYFPASRYDEYKNAYRLFGHANTLKIINSVDPQLRKDAAESILKEANIRAGDPVHGCYGIVKNLNTQIESYEKEISLVNQQLSYFREQEKLRQVKLDEEAKQSASVIDEFNDFGPIHDPDKKAIFDHGYNYQSTLNHGYNYVSTLEESKDIEPFSFLSFHSPLRENEPGEPSADSGAHEKQNILYDSDEEEADIRAE